jgi:hypothetical protein
MILAGPGRPHRPQISLTGMVLVLLLVRNTEATKRGLVRRI